MPDALAEELRALALRALDRLADPVPCPVCAVLADPQRLAALRTALGEGAAPEPEPPPTRRVQRVPILRDTVQRC